MDIKDLTNSEILYHADLKNKVLVKVPNTRFHILCTLVKSTELWNAHIIDMMSSRRKLIAKQIEQRNLTKLIMGVLDGTLKEYKHVNNIIKFALEFKNILINIKEKQQKWKKTYKAKQP